MIGAGTTGAVATGGHVGRAAAVLDPALEGVGPEEVAVDLADRVGMAVGQAGRVEVGLVIVTGARLPARRGREWPQARPRRAWPGLRRRPRVPATVVAGAVTVADQGLAGGATGGTTVGRAPSP